jgi:MFS family permease
LTGRTQSEEHGPNAAGSDLPSSLSAVAALLFGISLLLMGNGLQTTLIPVRGNLENFLAYEIGVLGATYFVGFTIGCYFGPALIRRAGHIRAYLAMVSAASVVALLHAMVLEPFVWWFLRAVTGFCFAVLFIVVESWLNERSTNKTRGTIFSIYIVINLTVISIGQMMLVLDDPKTFTLFALSSILVSLAAMPVAFTSASSPEPIPTVRPRPGKLYRTSPVGFLGCLAVGLANGAFWALGPVFAQDKGLDLLGVGLFMSATVIGGAISQWPLGWLSDRMDRRCVMLLAGLISFGAAVVLMLQTDASQISLLVGAAGFGMGAFPLYALSVAHANDHADPKDFVEVSSGLLLVYGLGASIGPVLAGILRQTVPGPTLFYFTAAIHLLLVLFVVWRMQRREAVNKEERIDFNDALVAAETVMTIEAQTAIDEQPRHTAPQTSN